MSLHANLSPTHITYAVQLVETWFFWSFFADFWYSFNKLVLSHRRSAEYLLPYRLIGLQSCLGMGVTALVIINRVYGIYHCRTAMFASLIALYLGTTCINGVLFVKVRFASTNQRRLIFIYISLELIRLSSLAFVLTTTPMPFDSKPCFVYILEKESVILTALTNCLENLVLSAYFLRLIKKYMKLMPCSGYLRAAMRDGAIYGLVIVATNLVAAVLNMFQLFGDTSDVAYVIDCIFIARLTCRGYCF